MTTMTTMTVCRNCGVRVVGVLVQCPECGSERMERYSRPAGCDCGFCETGENFEVIRCAGTAATRKETA